MKKGTRNIFKIIISIIYIVWGIMSPLTAVQAIIALNINAIVSAAVGVLTLLAGVFGLVGIKRQKCRIFGVVIFIFSAVAVIMALPALSWTAVINAVLAWLFIVCV